MTTALVFIQVDNKRLRLPLEPPINRFPTRLKAGLPQVRVRDFTHTFGRQLRAAGVSSPCRVLIYRA